MQVGAADKRLLQSTNAKTHYKYAHATRVPEWGIHELHELIRRDMSC